MPDTGTQIQIGPAQQPADDMLEEFDLFVNKVVPELAAPYYSMAAE